MAKAKSPRKTTKAVSKPVTNPIITAPESSTTVQAKSSAPLHSTAVDLELAIRQRAYELYLQRGRTPGHEHDDWARAEHEVLERVMHQEPRHQHNA